MLKVQQPHHVISYDLSVKKLCPDSQQPIYAKTKLISLIPNLGMFSVSVV